jgi:hypothetical protein
VLNNDNQILAIRSLTAARVLNNLPGVEIEVMSNEPFPVRNELHVLRIGNREFVLSRYPSSGETNRLIFTIPLSEFTQLVSGDEIWLQYGRQPARERWNFGRLDKTMLDLNL